MLRLLGDDLRLSPKPAYDRLLSAIAAALVLAVYLATIYPGLLDIGDATKFSFVGRILGTPHAPGYPLYVIVSHLFSYVPWGTLAYRMNALSAIFGAIAVALAYYCARRMGATRAVACSVAIALGFGQAFWSRALYAKTYTLNAALVAAGILLLLRWSDTRRPAHLYAAVAVFALSVGNHLTVIGLVPALALFTLLTSPRTVLHPKSIGILLALVVLGLSQYLFILLRTLQGAPYLESRARNLTELWAVMTARRFAHEIGAFSSGDLLSVRVPHIAHLLFIELGAIGLALVATGLIVLVRRRPTHALLLGGGAAGVVLLTTNMGSEEDQGFLLSALVLLWIAAATGLQWLVDAIRRDQSTVRTAAAVLAMALVPSLQVAANYRVNDHHAETFETRYFDALFAALPQKTAFVQNEYPLNMKLLYKLLGERVNGGRDIRLIPVNRDVIRRMQRAGFEVLTFRTSRDHLMQSGLAFEPFRPQTDEESAEALGRRELFRLTAIAECRDIANTGWHDLTDVALPNGRIAVRIDNFHAFDARLTLYGAAASFGTAGLVNAEGGGTPALEVEVFRRDDAAAQARLQERIASDGATLPDAIVTAPVVARVDVRVNDGGAYSTFGLDLGGPMRSVAAAATVDRNEPKRASVCSHPLAAADAFPTGQSSRDIALDSADVHFGKGWHALERKGRASWRWTSETARLVIPLTQPRPLTVSIEAEPLVHPRWTGTSVTLVINGRRLDQHALERTPTTVAWTIGLAHLHTGLNELVLEVGGATSPAKLKMSSDTRVLGMHVTRVQLAEAPVTAGR